MKNLLEPRAVLVGKDLAALELALSALRRVGVDGYRADSLASAQKMALREDTLLVLVDAAGLPLAEIETLLRTLRANERSATTLVAIIAADAHRASLRQAGANIVVAPPLTQAATLKAVNRLLRAAIPLDTERTALQEPHQALARCAKRGRARLKLFVGAAPGVGKTYAMLREAHDLVARHVHVVVGLVETHDRAETAAQLAGLVVLPRKEIDYKGTTQTELDLDAILALRPSVVLVDELAHTNAPGSLNPKRYEDVQLLLLAGIPVISAMNIQHLESLNGLVQRLTGVKVRETVPDTVLEEADEVVLVDISPETLQARLAAGKIYGHEKVEQSLANFFTTHNLSALRELVLRELADKVDLSLDRERDTLGHVEPTGIQEVVVVCLTPSPAAQHTVRRGARLAVRLNAELHAVWVEAEPLRPAAEQALARNIALAESFDAIFVRRQHTDPAQAIAELARELHATLLVIGESREPRWRVLLGRTFALRLLARTRNIDVVTVARPES